MAGSAYFKNTAQTPEEFDPVKFGITVVVGAAIGIASATQGNPDLVPTMIASGSLAFFVENIYKGVTRRLPQK